MVKLTGLKHKKKKRTRDIILIDKWTHISAWDNFLVANDGDNSRITIFPNKLYRLPTRKKIFINEELWGETPQSLRLAVSQQRRCATIYATSYNTLNDSRCVVQHLCVYWVTLLMNNKEKQSRISCLKEFLIQFKSRKRHFSTE